MKTFLIKAFVAFATLALSHSTLTGQSTFLKTIGGTGDETVNAVISTADNNFLLVGSNSSIGSGGLDGYISKIASDGTVIWSKVIGGAGDDELLSVVELANSDLLTLGSTKNMGGGNEDISITRMASDGEEIWTRTFGGSNDDRADGIIQTSDGNILISGWTKSFGAGQLDVVLLKIDPAGQTIWSKTFGRSGNEWCNFGGLIEDSEGNYVLNGAWTNNLGLPGHNGFIFKLNTNGELIASNLIGGSENDGMNGYLREKGGLYHNIAGAWSWNGGNHEIWMSEMTAAGDLNWSKTIGLQNENIRIGSATATDAGDFLISAYEFTSTTAGNAILIKVNQSGELIWAKSFGGAQVDRIHTAIETADGVLAFGYTTSFGNGGKDILIIKTDAQGEVPGCSNDIPLIFNVVSPSEASLNEIVGTFDSGADAVVTNMPANPSEIFVCENIITANENVLASTHKVSIFPNPTSGYFKVNIEMDFAVKTKLTLYNSLGKVVGQKVFVEDVLQTNFDISGLADGIYFLVLENANGRILQKVILASQDKV